MNSNAPRPSTLAGSNRVPLRLLLVLLGLLTAATAPAAPVIVDRVRFLPAPEREQAMVGGKFSGSNVSPSEGFKVLAEIKTAPPRGEWSELTFDNDTPYRWVRYEAPAGSHGNVAELEFYAGDTEAARRRLWHGGPARRAATGRRCFDGKPETWFNSNDADGQYVGLDLDDQAATARPAITPGGGDSEKPQVVTMKCAHARRDDPLHARRHDPGSARAAQFYTAAVHDRKERHARRRGVQATRSRPARPRSPRSGSASSRTPPMNSFHVGNSLTGNASRFTTFIRTAGGRDDFPAYLIGGSLTVKLWNESHGADKARWDADLCKGRASARLLHAAAARLQCRRGGRLRHALHQALAREVARRAALALCRMGRDGARAARPTKARCRATR